MEVRLPSGDVLLDADVEGPDDARGLVVFAHGSGSSRRSPRNTMVATRLRQQRLVTVLFDLLTPHEQLVDARDARLRFDIGLLADRLAHVVDVLAARPEMSGLPLGLFGASTGAAAALVTAAARPAVVRSVVSRGGRPDLAGDALPNVRAPTLLIVGGRDSQVLELNRKAADRISADCELSVVPGAGHLFEEPGALQDVARRAADWFARTLPAAH